MRVLIPTNDRTLTPSLVAAYANHGWQVATGVDNLYYRTSNYDLVHLQWPEELIHWQTPTEAAIKRLRAALAWWARRSRILSTVHNLLPHRLTPHRLDRDLYEAVYSFSHALSHFSQYSFHRVRQEFSSVNAKPHIVHPPFTFSHLLHFRKGRAQSRQHLGVQDGDFLIIGFGAFRSISEWRLFSFSTLRAKIQRKRVVFAGRLPGGTKLDRVRQEIWFQVWRMLCRATDHRGYAPDETIPTLFDAADAIAICRAEPHLNSGLLPLSMTFGTPLVAPRYGMYVEYLEGTPNVLYEPNNASDLSRALELLRFRPRESIVSTNLACASTWGWEKALAVCLPTIMDTSLRSVNLRQPDPS